MNKILCHRQLFDSEIPSLPGSLGSGSLAGASASLSVVILQNPVRIYPHRTAFLRVSLQFQQSEWTYFHAKWKFLTQDFPVLYYAVECAAGPSTANRTCRRTVEKEWLYEARADVEEDGSLVLRDVQPEDAGRYEIHVLALDVSARAEVELVVMEGNGRDLSFPGMQQSQGSTRSVRRKGAWGHARFPATVESRLPTKEGNREASWATLEGCRMERRSLSDTGVVGRKKMVYLCQELTRGNPALWRKAGRRERGMQADQPQQAEAAVPGQNVSPWTVHGAGGEGIAAHGDTSIYRTKTGCSCTHR